MTITTETKKIAINGRFPLLLSIDSNRNISACQCGIQDHMDPGADSQDYQLLLPLTQTDVNAAINSAANGRPAVAHYGLNLNGENRYIEIHCFPGHNRNGDVSCFLADRTSEQESQNHLKGKIYLLDIIGQAVKAFAETRNLSEILRIVLLSVTAGPGLGFNRGFVLLSNESRSHLWGCLAIGPSTAEEAGVIWQNLSQRFITLEEILSLYKTSEHHSEDIHVNKLVASLKIPLYDDANIIVKAIKDGQSVITTPEMMEGESNADLRERFGTDRMAIVPLISREGLQGVLIADNLITGKSITDADLKVLEIFARYASDAIENSRLYGKLEQQVCRLKEANEKIIQSRENLIRAEKLSSVAKMALDVAHEIRNPLTVIGGYANSYLRKAAPGDPAQKILDIISKQSSRIEGALDRFSSVVSLSEKKEAKYNLVSLLRETLGMLSSNANMDLPHLSVDTKAEGMMVFIDKGLFYQAMMVLFRKALEVSGGMQAFSVHAVRFGESGTIYILGSDDCPHFAEEFYRSLKDPNDSLKAQETAVALEILQHYGGSVSIATGENGLMHLGVEFPLCEEVK